MLGIKNKNYKIVNYIKTLKKNCFKIFLTTLKIFLYFSVFFFLITIKNINKDFSNDLFELCLSTIQHNFKILT